MTNEEDMSPSSVEPDHGEVVQGDEEAVQALWTAPTQSESRSESDAGSVTPPDALVALPEDPSLVPPQPESAAPPPVPVSTGKAKTLSTKFPKIMGKPSSVTLKAKRGEDTGRPRSWSFKTKLFLGVLGSLSLIAVAGFVAAFTMGREEKDGPRGSIDPQTGLFQEDIFTERPGVPTAAPTTGIPTTSPTAAPTSSPTGAPTPSPTSAPTQDPTPTPTAMPTPEPTRFFVSQNPVPSSPPRGYFNYDNSSPWGPRRWNRVDTRNHWLKEFGPNGYGPWKGHFREDLTRNICNGPDRKQSPKNLVGTVECEATHEIRTECASDPLTDDDAFEKKILPYKLTIIARRRPCLRVTESGSGVGQCAGDRPPMADYPRYASSGSAYSDLHHVDIKVPGEHTIEGEAFDAEMQLFHTHLTYPRLSSIGVPIRATNGGYNEEFQWILESFEVIYQQNRAACEGSRTPPLIAIANLVGNLRRRVQEEEFKNSTMTPEEIAAEVTAEIAPHNATLADAYARKLLLLHRRKFNPYSDSFLTTMFFYRYDGSITEPPCRDITWWVMDKPMLISFAQLAQLKKILFKNVTPSCRGTSVHNADMSSARPIFPLGNERDIEHCPTGSFRSDISKGRPPAKRCRG